ncbi:MAG TPA: acyl-CoA dehydrogenase family protein [Myxococcota bacterium]|nr:acyl-CoA dehydrogenase family protein [Myxococcota bacterium]
MTANRASSGPEAIARSLVDEVRARADEIEAARRLPADLSRRFAESGLYRVWVPKRYGGLEAPLVPVLRALELLAVADASAAWCGFIATTSSTALGGLPEKTAREVFSTPETLLCGVFAPHGRAEACPGGFRASGQWSFGSGTQNADWVLAGCQLMKDGAPVRGDDGAPRQHMVLVPAAEVEFLDTWHVAGLCGTGSTDFRLTDVFVPEERVVGWKVRRPLDLPLFTFPNFTLLAMGIGAVALGVGRAAIDSLNALARAKQPTHSSKTLAERADVQSAIAQAEAQLRSARAFYYEAAEAGWEAAQGGGRPTLAHRRDIRVSTTHAAATAVRVAQSMYECAGGTSLYKTSPLQRQLRDAHAITQHVMVGRATWETAGRAFLGIESGTQLL